jgi:ankyrin repeat protein
MPASTPLHWAAALNREEMARLLLEKGADPNLVAGNGLTALDLAEARGAAALAAALAVRGGKRAGEL